MCFSQIYLHISKITKYTEKNVPASIARKIFENKKEEENSVIVNIQTYVAVDSKWNHIVPECVPLASGVAGIFIDTCTHTKSEVPLIE